MSFKRITCTAFAVLGLTFLISSHAAATLTVTPLTWNVIGLDSNSPTSGPKYFPVGARVCSSVATTNVTVNFVWDSANANINLRTGTLSSINIASLGAGGCSDAYFEAEVTQVAAAYDTTRRYHITATDTSGTVSTPTPRELYVEHLVSQNRNGITDIKLNGSSVAAGGAMTLMVGNTYTIELDGFTATQGYNQLESFINFPNTIFQLLSVSTTYTADSNTTNVPNPNSRLYADACVWDSNPGSPTYRSCVGGDDKAGGTVAITYTVKIISGAGTSQTLNSMFYDFSGSSYHYNADYGVSSRIVNVVGPSSVTISKTFSPKAISPGGTSVMTFKLANPTTLTFTGVNFTDSLLGGLKVASTPGVTYSGCGTGAFSPALGANDTSLSFSGATLSPNSICTITVNVTAASAGTYPNTTGNLFINTSTDTGNTGSDTLTASSAAACTPGQTLATWTFETAAGTGVPPLYTTKASNVSTATASFSAGATGGAQSINTTQGSPAVNSWEGSGFQKSVTYTSTTAPYFDITVDTSKYSGVSISLRSYATANWGTSNVLRVWSSSDGGTSFGSTTPATGTLVKTTWSGDQTFAAASTGSSTTIFRINADGANPSGASMMLDNIVVTGCGVPTPAPTISKSFSSPIVKSGTSTLSFTISNTATGNQALTGIAFSDVFPSGLSIADSSTTQCSGTLTTTASTRTIALTGGSLAAGGSCSFNVTITGTTEGHYDNTTGYISSTESGTSTNYATSSLIVIAPPALAKSFSPTSIFTGNTATLSFTVTNPNALDSLSGIGFTDTLPAGLTVATSGPTTTCGSGSLSTTNPSTISFSGLSLAANSSCTFSVTVTSTTSGTKNNTTSVVTSNEGGNGSAASGSLVVNDQTASLDLTKQVSATGSDPWTTFIGVATGSNVYYRFKVYNSGDLSFSALSVGDPTLASTTVDPATCNWSASLPLAAGATATCVQGPISATTGSNSNTATAQGTYASGTKTSSPSTARYATTGLTIAKSVTESSYAATGNLLHYGYLVTNSGYAPLLGPVTVADNKATVTCPAVNTVGDLSDYLDQSESITCTATYTVTGADVTAKSVTNTASATVSGVTSPTDSRTVDLAPDLTVTKTNNVSGSVVVGNSFIWTLTVTNSASAGSSASFSNTQRLLTDDLPSSGATYSVGTVTTAGGTGGTINCSIATNTLTCTASGTATLPVGGSFSVPITVTPTAGGSLVNPRSAGICAADPLGSISEVDETNNSCSNTVTVSTLPDLTISKSHSGSFTQGQVGATYTVTVTNSGSSDKTAGNTVTVTDTAPGGLTITAMSGTGWTCTTLPSCTRTDALTAGSSYPAITVTVTVAANATSPLVNNVSVSLTGQSESNTGNNTATDSTTITALPDLTITKSHSGSFAQGQVGATYTVTVTNSGSADKTAGNTVSVTDTAPSGLTITAMSGTGWTCTTLPTCTRSDALTAGSSYPDVTVTVTVAANATTPLVNSVSVSLTGQSESNTSNNTANDSTIITALPDLTIAKSHSGSFAQGQVGATYTVTVTNNGSGDKTNGNTVSVTDTPPSGLTITAMSGTGWTCATLPTCTRTDALTAGNSYPAITVTVTVAANATSPLVNNVSVSLTGQSESNTSNNSASDSTTITQLPDLTIAKTHSGSFAQGQTNAQYSITVTNSGSGDKTAGNTITVTDTAPGGLTITAMSGTGWTCTTLPTCTRTDALTAGSSYPAITVTVTVAGNATSPLVNSVSVSLSGQSESDTGNNTANDSTTISPVADLSITKSSNPSPYVPGAAFTYTLVVNNAGPSDVTNAQVEDTLPAALSGFGWTCTASGAGASCGTASGTGNINALVTLPSGTSATFAVSGTLSSGAAGTLSNTATVTPPAGTTDPVPGNNSASNVSPIGPQADLSITKSSNPDPYVPGAALTYTIVVNNAGPSNVTDARVQDALPAALSAFTWNCAASGTGASCGTASGTGDIDALVTLPSGTSATFTVTGTVPSATTGTLSNTATVAPPSGTTDPVPGNNSSNDTNPTGPQADLKITKTSSPDPYVAGSAFTYTITVNNAGPSDATNARVQDTLPAALSGFGWTCTPSGVGASCGTASGTSNIDVFVTLPSGMSATFTVTGTVPLATTGTLSNTATVTPPSGTTDPVPGNNSSSNTNPSGPQADLQITKTSSPDPYVAGSAFTYTITASNAGPSDVTNARVQDALPAALAGFGWTCTPSGVGASCGTASGTGDIDALVTLPNGTHATFSVSGTLSAGTAGTLSNTATVTPPSGTTDPVPGNNSSSNTNPSGPQADLQITKTDGSATYTPGNGITYTIVVTNAGPSFVTGATVADTLPATITGATWTAVFTGTGSSGNASGSGNINETINLAVGGTATYTVSGTVSPAATGNLVNTATVSAPSGITDTNTSNNSAADTDTSAPQADLSITKTDGSATYTPGNGITYTIVVTNNGPSFATGATVADTLPAAITGATWTAVFAGTGSSGNASGSGNISETINLAVGGIATYTVSGTVSPAATGNLVNTATVSAPSGATDPTPGNNSATDTDTQTSAPPQPDLTIAKTHSGNFTQGQVGATYTITVTNSGSGDKTAGNTVTVTDTAPSGLTITAMSGTGWTCTTLPTCTRTDALTAGSSYPAITVTVTVAANATTPLINSVSVSLSGQAESNTTNNTASDSTTITSLPDLTIAKTHSGSFAQGQTNAQYTITVTNSGSGNKTAGNAVSVTDTAPSGLTITAMSGTGWTCTTLPTCTRTDALTAGNSYPAITVTVTVAGNATSPLINSVSVSLSGQSELNTSNNTATDSTTISPVADLSITKSSSPDPYVPGAALTYTIVVSNAGPSDATNARVQDALPAALSAFTWSCVASGTGASCGTASGSGDIDVLVTLPSGTQATFTVSGTVPSATTGTLLNTATVTPPAGTTDPVPGNNSSSDTNPTGPQADLKITKSSSPNPYVAGAAFTYTITANNAGPSDVTNARVQDTLPAALTGFGWTCTPSGVGASCGSASGSGDIDALVTLPNGTHATFLVSGTVPSGATGALANTATVTPPAGTTDPVPGDNSSSDTNPTGPQADLSVTKDDGISIYTPGGTITYAVVVSNAGPSNVTNARVQDALPAALSGFGWTCTPSGVGASCGTAGGSGDIDVFVTLPSGTHATFTVTGTVPSGTTGSLVNTATVTAPSGVTDPTPANNSATDTDTLTPQADLTITKTHSGTFTQGQTNAQYTVTITNSGSGDKTAGNTVSVTDTAPSGLTITAMSGTGWTCTTLPTCTRTDALTAGSSYPDITVTVTVAANATTPLINSVSVSLTGQAESNTTNNTATDSTTITTVTPLPDLTIAKSHSGNFTQGQVGATYTITVTNGGSGDKTVGNTVSVTDTAPSGLTITAMSGTGWTCTTLPTCTRTDALTAGGSYPDITVTATVSANATSPLINNVSVSLTGQSESNTSNNTATDSTTIVTITPFGSLPDLTIAKSHSGNFTQGQVGATYTVTVTNSGSGDKTVGNTVSVTDTAPSGLTITAMSGTGWTCTTLPTCTRTDVVTAGSSYPGITVTVTVAGNATSPLINSVSVSLTGQSESNTGNNTANDSTTITGISRSADNGSISGRVWLDANHNRRFDIDEIGRDGWLVALLSGGTVIAVTPTSATGRYTFSNLAAGPYSVRFINANGAILATGPTPVNGETGSPIAGGGAPTRGLLSGIVLTTDSNGDVANIVQQSLPLDPSGVVYDSMTRQPVTAATVTLLYNGNPISPANVAGGSATQTTGAGGTYSFLLLPGAPAGTYGLSVSAAGYLFPSTGIPSTSVPGGFSGGPVTAISGAPQSGQDTTYYLQFPLPTQDITNNNLPLDPAVIRPIPSLSTWNVVLLAVLLGWLALRHRSKRQIRDQTGR